MPPALAANFTAGEQAALSVIARQCQRAGACVLPIDAIAALAGGCRTAVKNAMRQARLLGLLHIKERRIPGRKSLTNIVRVISTEWLGWLRIGPAGIGGRNLPATGSAFSSTARAGGYRPHVWLRGDVSRLLEEAERRSTPS